MLSLFGLCCTNRTKDSVLDAQRSSLPTTIIQGARANTNRILRNFAIIEEQLFAAFQDVDAKQLFEDIVRASAIDGSRPHKGSAFQKYRLSQPAFQKLCKNTPHLQINSVLARCLKLDLLFTDESQDYFDTEKLLCFVLFYSSDSLELKSEQLFNLLCNDRNSKIEYPSANMPRIFGYLV